MTAFSRSECLLRVDFCPSLLPDSRHSEVIHRAEASTGSDRPHRELEPRSISVDAGLANDGPKALTVLAQLAGELLGRCANLLRAHGRNHLARLVGAQDAVDLAVQARDEVARRVARRVYAVQAQPAGVTSTSRRSAPRRPS